MDLEQLQVAFDGRTVDYSFKELDALVPAYATTIHKSQGSEYPAVVLPIMKRHFVMLQRNLIYTGITRARRLVVVLGQPRRGQAGRPDGLAVRPLVEPARIAPQWLGDRRGIRPRLNGPGGAGPEAPPLPPTSSRSRTARALTLVPNAIQVPFGCDGHIFGPPQELERSILKKCMGGHIGSGDFDADR